MKRVERWRGGPAGKCIIIYTQAPGERELCIVRAAAFLCVSDGEGRPAAVFLPPSLLPSNHSALTIRARLVISNLNSFFSSFRCKTISQHSNGNRVGGDARGSFFVASLRSFNKIRTRQPKTQKRRGGAIIIAPTASSSRFPFQIYPHTHLLEHIGLVKMTCRVKREGMSW